VCVVCALLCACIVRQFSLRCFNCDASVDIQSLSLDGPSAEKTVPVCRTTAHKPIRKVLTERDSERDRALLAQEERVKSASLFLCTCPNDHCTCTLQSEAALNEHVFRMRFCLLSCVCVCSAGCARW
jgi:hypothetical protein